MRSRVASGSMPIINASDASRPGPAAEHDPATRHVVELDDAVRDVQRVVIRQRHDTGAEAEVLGAFGRGGDEDLRRVDRLHPRRVVLADPRFRETQPSSISISSRSRSKHKRGVLGERVERCEEDAVPEIHRESVSVDVGSRFCHRSGSG